MSKFIYTFSETSIAQVSEVGGKNASLGEMIKHLKPKGINIPEGFATSALAFTEFLKTNNINKTLSDLLHTIDKKNYTNLQQVSMQAKELVMNADLQEDLKKEIRTHYEELCKTYGRELDVAVRSSATAEDLPNASFAGQHESFLNIKGIDNVLLAVKKCFASLYNGRAIKYRNDNGFEHDKVYLSAGIQLMVRSDLSSSGVAFTIEPDSGFKDVIVINGCWGLGENIVQGAVTPDEFHVFKPTLQTHQLPIISKKLGTKARTLVYDAKGFGTLNSDTPIEKQKQWTLNNDEILTIARWSKIIEEHYKMPMDIEWAKDGISDELFIVQARPETVHSMKDPYTFKEYTIKKKGTTLASGNAVGTGITSGIARILSSPAESDKLQNGEVLITDITNPDWDPIMKKAAAIITNKGGRTSHAAIVARELGPLPL